MSRIDDIKARLEIDKSAGYWPTYYDTITYLLDRIAKMEKIKDAAKVIVSDGTLTPDCGTVLVDEPLIAILSSKLAALDADEKETT